MAQQLIYPMVAHVALAALLYALLTIFRAPSIWGLGRRADGSNPWARLEPRVSANLSNQFEWPLLFYIACVLLIQQNSIDSLAPVFAWTFVVGRIIHSGVQILSSNVRLRGIVFTINFIAVLALWALLLRIALQAP